MTYSAPVTGTIIDITTVCPIGLYFQCFFCFVFAMDLSLKSKKDNLCFSVIV